jgi:chromosome partitioning protein
VRAPTFKSPRKNWASSLPKDTQRVVIDTAAGTTADELECYLDEIDALVVPILPSVFDLESSSAFLASVAKLPKIKRGKVAVGLIANRLKPWTHQSSESIREISQWPFPLIAQLRDSTGYVVLTGLGKSIFDFNSEQVRNHQEDWMPLLRWLKKTK